MPHEGPAGMPRPLVRCNLQTVVVLVGRDGDIDEEAMRQEIENRIEPSVTVTSRQPRFVGDKEVVVSTRTNVLLEDQVEDTVSAVNNQLRQQNLGFEVQDWRIET